MTTLAGLTPMAEVGGTQRPNLPAGVKSTDAYGDGCLAVNGIITTAAYSGVVTDPYGNLYASDDSVAGATGVLHKINPAKGIMTLVAGNNTVCGSPLDSSSEGWVAATGTTGVADRCSVGIDPYGNNLTCSFGTETTPGSATCSGTITNAGNQLAAGTYNINASYPGGSSAGPIFSSSATSSGTSFTVGQVGTAVSSWTPGVTTQQVSAAIGTGVLNATATPAGVAGNFVYTATCTSGSCTQYSNTTIDPPPICPLARIRWA